MIGLTAGMLGVFALLRHQSLLGDAISHAALPGIALALLLTGTGSPLIVFGGGFSAGIIGTGLFVLIQQKTTLKSDAILGIILSVFFGFGLVLMTIMQKYAIANQAIMQTFLFGNAATLALTDLYLIGGIGFFTLLILFAFWKEFKLLTFDPAFAHSLGMRVLFFDACLTLLLVVVMVVGLQTVGAILMTSLLIAPAAAARLWTTTLRCMLALAAFFGLLSCMIGCLISNCAERVPTGPVIVVVASFIVFSSLFLRRRYA